MIVLTVRDLVKTFRSGSSVEEAVRGVSFEIAGGEILAYLGANGAGKTTTIKMIAGLVRPTSGQVLIEGLDPNQTPNALRQVGAVLEGSRNIYWNFTAEENFEYFGGLRGLGRREAQTRGADLTRRFGLEGRRGTPTRKLSRGMQQKVAIMVALLHRPRLLLLDEPTLGLDVHSAAQVKEFLREIAAEGQAILLTTHQLQVAEEISHRVAILRKGRLLVEEPTQELLRRFSSSSYRIDFDGTLEEWQTARLLRMGADLDSEHLLYHGEAQGLYDVLEVLRPLKLLRVQNDSNNLTEVFLRLMDEKQGA